jgi:hypothetical protein
LSYIDVVASHRTLELQSIAMHGIVAARLDEQQLARARARLRRWLDDEGPVPPDAAQRWLQLLSLPLPELRSVLVADTEEMRQLRQNTPFAGTLSQEERLRVLRAVE